VNPYFPSPYRRAAFTLAGALALTLPTTGQASAHVEVHAEGAQAGTGPVTVSFSAESESPTVGIVRIKTQLPQGIDPADVSLATAPAGWTLVQTDDGFELSGPELGAGLDAEYGVTVAQLPSDATELTFPTLQYYADGREDAWIEPVTDAVPEPQKPAPVLTVAPAVAVATTAAATSTSADSASPRTAAASNPATDERSSIPAWALTGVAALVGLLAVGLWAWRRRAR
jgi:uncharacterized protein YcnI